MKVEKKHARTSEQAAIELGFMAKIAPAVNASEFHKMWLQLRESYKKFGVDFVIDSIIREPRKTADTLWMEITGGRRRFNV